MSIIQKVLDGDWANLRTDLDKLAADKVMARVEDKKIDVLANINGVSRAQMQEVMNLKDSE